LRKNQRTEGKRKCEAKVTAAKPTIKTKSQKGSVTSRNIPAACPILQQNPNASSVLAAVSREDRPDPKLKSPEEFPFRRSAAIDSARKCRLSSP
jgi:hypothetical protein